MVRMRPAAPNARPHPMKLAAASPPTAPPLTRLTVATPPIARMKPRDKLPGEGLAIAPRHGDERRHERGSGNNDTHGSGAREHQGHVFHEERAGDACKPGEREEPLVASLL